MRATLSIIFIFLVFSPLSCRAQESGPQTAAQAVVLLRSASTTICGSGVLLEGALILTASHLARSLCPLNDCGDMEVLRGSDSEAVVKPHAPGKGHDPAISLYRDFPALDMALLKIAAPAPTGGAISLVARTPEPGLAVYAASFPGCQRLELTPGQITRVHPLRFETSATGARGSSGGALFDSDSRLVGIITQAQGLEQALSSLFSGEAFPLRIARLDVLAKLLAESPVEAIRHQAALLVDSYYSETLRSGDLQRMVAGSGFVSGVEGLAQSIRSSDVPAAYKALPGLLCSTPSALLDLTLSPRPDSNYFPVELAFAMAALEATWFAPIDPTTLREAMISSGRPEDTAGRLFAFATDLNNSERSGSRRSLVRNMALALAGTVLLILLWSWSLGFVFASLERGFIRRVLVMLAVAVLLWPLSFFVFLLIKRRARSITALALLIPLLFAQPTRAQTEKPLAKIAFGSCIKQDQPQPVWASINSFGPDTMLLLGDNVYSTGKNMPVLRAAYQKLVSQPGLKQLTRNSKVFAVWDDNDYGMADGGADYPMREDSKRIFLDFFPLPRDPRREHAGIYYSLLVGPPGQRTQLIFLDTRSFRGHLVTGPQHLGVHSSQYLPNRDASVDLLGAQQWRWLAGELEKQAELRLLISSIQVLATEHGGEKWANFPHEREKLFRLLNEKRAQRLVILSGDRHYSELSRLDGVLPYPLYDFTSSSLTMDSPHAQISNSLRLGPQILKANFGALEIDWKLKAPSVTLAIRDAISGQAFFSTRVSLKGLQIPSSAPSEF